MSRLTLSAIFAALLVSYHAASALPTSANFTFPIPYDPNDANSLANWIGVVCLRPDQITLDQCRFQDFEWVRCPNGDVSGILVRVSGTPEEASAGVWTQLLTVYSLLISGVISIRSHTLSRFHAGMTVFLVMSPLSATLVVYAILGFCGRSHRLDSILSKRRAHLLPRVLIIIFGLISLAFLIFAGLASDKYFTPVSPCDSIEDKGVSAVLFDGFIFIPYVGVAMVILVITALYGPTAAGDATSIAVTIGASTPFILLVIALICAIIKSRHALAEQFRIRNNRWKFWVFWEFSEERYPFLHFCGVFLVPMIYWVIVNETRLNFSPDNVFSPSFGQVLALFVVLQPLLQVLQMIPRAARWFRNLAVIRLFTRRPRELVEPVSWQIESQEFGSFGSRDKLVV
ncbi:hypothetical protein B0H19DRAFT_1068815 [Mycena capillaripes]|nr:hypothetical protein B0H19DRAFT_1068815 [Mycena capillaripes]